MKITRFRIKKAYICFVAGINQGRSIYWSFRLSMWWFRSGYKFRDEETSQ